MNPAPELDCADDDPLEGTPFRALRVLGKGGMGVVYRAVDRKSGKVVAVKMLHDDLLRDAELVERFQTEAEVAGLLDHPNVVRVHELRMPPAVKRPYFVLEALEGETVSERLHRKGALPVAEAIDVTLQALEGLAAAHGAGVVHRDIKPSNLFLCEGEPRVTVKILDFGIAKLLPPDQRSPQFTPHSFETREGAFVGTALYASPEQARGKPVDRRTDVYAMGNVLYNLLTGRSPFGRVKETRALLRLHQMKMPDPPSMLARSPIPPELDELVMAALAKRAEDRFASAEAFAEALEEIGDKLANPAGWLKTHLFDPDEARSLRHAQPPDGKDEARRPVRRRRSKRRHRDYRSLLLVSVAVAAGCVVAAVILLVARGG